ncbi:Imm1 family immunity protein [Streptomyces tauricus]|uniref:Imm1 family immunity protein n=1 Tax=Streptomyces tauricus TaxID=68274 RepID=UPI00339FE571
MGALIRDDGTEDAEGNAQQVTSEMIVLGGTHAGEFYARTEREVSSLIDHIMSELIQEGRTPDGFEIIPEMAVLSIVKGKYPEESNERWPNNYMYVSVNNRHAYGALKWWTANIPEGSPENDVTRSVWTSGVSTPPPFDPRLISDPGTPTYYPPEAAIPVKLVREAVEEFCRSRTGARPECLPWQRLEQSV